LNGRRVFNAHTHSGRGGVPPKNDSMPSCNVGATHNGVRHTRTRANRNRKRICKLDLMAPGHMAHGNRANNGDECGTTTGERRGGTHILLSLLDRFAITVTEPGGRVYM